MGDDWDAKCKHCGARPFLPGPHHKLDCPRHAPSDTSAVDDAYDHDCMHCGARPYTPGPHHKMSCPRWTNRITHKL